MNTGNMGVSALAASLVNLVRQVRPDAEIFFFMGNRTSEPQRVRLAEGEVAIPVVNYRLSPRGGVERHLLWLFLLAVLHRLLPLASVRRRLVRSNPCLRALGDADFVGSIHGGDSFSDIYGLGSFVLGSLPDVIVLLLGKRLVLLPQTYGPYSSRVARSLAGLIIRRAALVLSRDSEGIEVVKGILHDEHDLGRVRFCPDVAFSLAVVPPPEGAVEPPLTGGTIIGLNISGLLYNGGFSRDNMFGLKFDYREFVHALAERILSETDARLLLVPHTYAWEGHVESDPDACRAVYAALPASGRSRVHLVTAACDQSEIKGVIARCDMFVGSRMHACIAALSQGIPTVGVAYSRKFQGVFDSIGVGNLVVDARSASHEEAIRTVIDSFRAFQSSGAQVSDKSAAARDRLRATFRGILETAGSA